MAITLSSLPGGLAPHPRAASRAAPRARLSHSTRAHTEPHPPPPHMAPKRGDADFLGVPVRKHFTGHGWFNGTVVKVTGRAPVPFRVAYEDGDEEDMDRERSEWGGGGDVL